MSQLPFRQADAQRWIRALKSEGVKVIEFDLRSLVIRARVDDDATVDNLPNPEPSFSAGILAPDGEENFDEN